MNLKMVLGGCRCHLPLTFQHGNSFKHEGFCVGQTRMNLTPVQGGLPGFYCKSPLFQNGIKLLLNMIFRCFCHPLYLFIVHHDIECAGPCIIEQGLEVRIDQGHQVFRAGIDSLGFQTVDHFPDGRDRCVQP